MKRIGLLTATAASLMLTTALAIAQSPPGGGTSGSQSPGSPPSAGGSTGGEIQKDEGRARKSTPGKATQGKVTGEKDAKETQSTEERNGRHERGEKRNSQQEQKGDHKRRTEEPASRQNREGGKSSTAKAGERNNEGKRGGHASLTTEQRTKISHAIRSRHVRVENNINFSIRAGTRVPASIHFYTVPVEIVDVYPEYRGYEYFVAEDEIIVVNPRTREIVAVLPYA